MVGISTFSGTSDRVIHVSVSGILVRVPMLSGIYGKVIHVSGISGRVIPVSGIYGNVIRAYWYLW